MTKLMRFGRRLTLPSTRQIRHELIVMMREDERRNQQTKVEPDLGSTFVDRNASTPPLG